VDIAAIYVLIRSGVMIDSSGIIGGSFILQCVCGV